MKRLQRFSQFTMIQFESLEWGNMFSYGGSNSIDFSANPITQLVGANGHGKSSIPLILEESLYNKNSKGIKKGDIVNRNLNTNKYNCRLKFKVFEDAYDLEVNRSGATQKVKLQKNGSDISSHTATDTFKQVEALIGFDFKTFTQLVYQNSSSSLQFLTATDTARKNFLIELLSLDKYVRIFDTIKVVHKEVADDILTIKGKLSSINSWLSENASVELDEMPLQEVPVADPTVEENIIQLSAKVYIIDDLNSKISKNISTKATISTINTKLSKSVKPEVPDTTAFSEEIGKLEHSISLNNAILKKYSGLASGTCPTCGQATDVVTTTNILNTANASIAEATSQLKLAREKISEAEALKRQAEAHQKLVNDLAKYTSMLDTSLPDMQHDKTELEAELATLNARLAEFNKKVKAAQQHNNSAAAHNAKLASITEMLSKFKSDAVTLNSQLEQLNDKLGLLDVLKKTFSTNGLLAYKIENSVKELEQLTNNYLSELSDGRFQLEFVLNNDKLNVVIVDNGHSIDISALSAGELARVNTSTLLAIRKLMSGLSKCQINLLFLDETIETLDAFGKEKLIEVLLNEENLNTFLVSHSYTHPLIAKILVVKEDGISRLENG